MKKIVSCLSLLLIFASVTGLSAQDGTGKISGKIVDKSTGEELIGATVQVEGIAAGALTDVEGKFLISLKPGSYTLAFKYISFHTEKAQVDVKANEITYVNMALAEEKNELAEVVVTYTIEKSTSLAMMIERKNAPQLSDGVSADLIRKTPDRTSSDVLKRVTGASIQEGKFVVIRGMNDRYNAGYLDGALLPSTEADRKAFAFDAVPANLIDNLTIIKTGSADLIGDFGGGVIKINTKAIPERVTQSLSIGGQMHSLTTFKNFTGFKQYSGEALNILNPDRNLPDFAEGALKPASLFPTGEEKTQFAEISQKFNNDWSNSNNQALPNGRFAYSLGMPLQLSPTKKVGLILALNYANTRRFTQNNINTFDGSGQVSAFKNDSYLQNISSGGILNVNYVAARTQVNFRNLLNVNTDHNAILRTGTGNFSDALTVQTMANLVNYNRLYNGIVSLKQIIAGKDGKQMTLNTSVNYSNVRRRLPDYRIVNYTKTPDFEEYQLSLGDFFNTSTGRFSSDLKENLYGTNLDLSKQFSSRNVRTELKFGGLYQHRDRSFEGRSFVYAGRSSALTYNPAQDLGADQIAANRLFLLEKTSDDIGYYNGKSDLSALFLMADHKIFERLRTVYGLRYENADIQVTNEKIGSKIARIQEPVWLPSANITYSLTDKVNLRSAYYASVNRPEFRELAPFAFYVFDKNAEIRGNQNLKIAQLNNYDLRMEFYPSGSQLISVGGFYKSLKNPVEFNIDVTQPFTTFTYGNEKAAHIYGLEFEIRKNFDFISGANIWKDIVVFSNLALVKSKLDFSEGSQASPDRPLQGQSPYIINAGLQYENSDNGWFSSVVLNRVGRRIAFVGVDPKFGDTRQDIYEAPRTVLDFQIGKNIGKFNLKLTLGDLLHQDLIYYQDADHNGKYGKDGAGDRLMFNFSNGFTGALTVGYTL